MGFTLYVHPGAFSCWSSQLLLQELGLKYKAVNVDLYSGHQFSGEFLRLSPLGAVPVLLVDTVPVVGAQSIRNYLKNEPDFAQNDVFKGEGERFLCKLDSAPVGSLTYGLAFHQQYTKLLRYPYCAENFLELASEYILNRAAMLKEAAAASSDPQLSQTLIEAAVEHERKLPCYLEVTEYEAVLKTIGNLLDLFEKEFEGDREGLWLGGLHFNVADISLGLLLHRIWQLGMENDFFAAGVRPHLAVYYERVKQRKEFEFVTQCQKETGEKRILSEEDRFANNARMGIGVALIAGGLFLGRKLLKR